MLPATTSSAVVGARRSRLSKGISAKQLANLREQLQGDAALARLSAGPGDLPLGFGGPYDAAGTTRLRDFVGGGRYGIQPRPEDDMLRPYDRRRIVARGRLEMRNNPYFYTLVAAYVREIGTPAYKSSAVLATPEETKAYNTAREARLQAWMLDCESVNDLSLEDVVEIINYERVIGGEIFLVTLRTGEVQLIPTELCGSENLMSGPVTAGTLFQDGTAVPVGAVERDGIVRAAPNGRVIGYRFAARQSDLGWVDFSAKNTTIVAARYVIHHYDPDRVEMGRGVPATSPWLTKSKDLYETSEARAQQVKNQACLSMAINKDIDPYGFAQAMQGFGRAGLTQQATDLATIAAQRSQHTEIRSGVVYYLGTNEKVSLIEPKAGAQFHEHYIDLAQICAACLDGMPVEIAFEGFRNSSYSSARGTVNVWKRNVLRRRRRISSGVLDPLAIWQTNRFELFGDLADVGAAQNSPDTHYWGWPPIPDIDDLKTSSKNAMDIAMGARSLKDIYADNNQDYETGIAQISKEKGEFLKLLVGVGINAGLTADQARAWAITQVPGDSNSARALAALITATGALGSEPALVPSKPIAH